MITRPLDLASQLQPEPRSFDALFYINVGLVGLFFTLFGSRFVLSPGVELPAIGGARSGAISTTSVLKVRGSGQLLTSDGLLANAQLPEWLNIQSHKYRHPVLLIESDTRATTGEVSQIVNLARKAGFVILLAADDSTSYDGGTH